MFFEWVDCVASFATASMLFVAVKELRQNEKNRREDVLHDRRQATLEAYNQLQAEALDKLYADYSPARIREIVQSPQAAENTHEYHVLGTYIARIEHFCVGVVQGIYDEDTVYELAHGFLDGSVRERILPVIEKKTQYAKYDPYQNTREIFRRMDEKKQAERK